LEPVTAEKVARGNILKVLRGDLSFSSLAPEKKK